MMTLRATVCRLRVYQLDLRCPLIIIGTNDTVYDAKSNDWSMKLPFHYLLLDYRSSIEQKSQC